MKLVERYLQAIAIWLPKEQRDDILAELREDIQARMEEREAMLGRSLTKDDVAAVLSESGPPVVVAGRYLPQRHLIGPAFFPIYRFTVKLVVLWILVPVFALIVGPLAISTSKHPFLEAVGTLWTLAMAAVFTTGVITIVFALLERFDPNALYRWNPAQLPPTPPKKSPAAEAFALRCSGGFEFVWGILISVAWVYVCWFRPWMDIGGAHVALMPICQTLFVPILLLLVAGIPVGWITMRDPSRRRLRSGLRVAINAYFLGLIGILAMAGNVVSITGAGISAADLAEASKWTRIGVQIGLGALAICVFIDAAVEAYRLCRSARNRNSTAIVAVHH